MVSENPNVGHVGPWSDMQSVCAYLGKPPGVVNAMLENFEILGCRFNDGEVYFPVRQFSNNGIVAGLGDVLRVLQTGIPSPQVWASWLAAPDGAGQTGWDALKAGRMDDVIVEARRDAARWSGSV